MDAINCVSSEVNNVLMLLAENKEKTTNLIDVMIQELTKTRDELNKSSESNQKLDVQQARMTQTICDTIKGTCKLMKNSHLELHVPLTKIGKSIDKNFIADYSCVADANYFRSQENSKLLTEAIIEHLLRHGLIDVARKLTNETNMKTFDEKHLTKFKEIDNILNELKNKNLKPVLDWAIKNRSRLNELGSSLEFTIHRLNIIELVKKGIDKQFEIIKYARDYLQNIGPSYEAEIQQLMGCIVYLKTGIENSPYKQILDPIKYQAIEQNFIRDACALLGLSQRSPLDISVEAGAIALPALLEMNKKIQGLKNVWQVRNELPVSIDLGSDLHFHSVFSCPILKQQGNEDNPPMRLICGHVISKDALNKLTITGNSAKLKCPYCPVEQNPGEAKQIYYT